MDVTKQDGFILRKNNFRIDPLAYNEIIAYKNDLFNDVYKLTELLEANFDSTESFDKEAKNEFLDDVCNRIFKLVCSHSNRYQIFESYVDFCPAYLEAHGEEVEKYLRSEDTDAKKMAYYLNLQANYAVFDACLFSALRVYIEHTERVDALSIGEFLYARLKDMQLNMYEATHEDLLQSRKRKRERISDQKDDPDYKVFKKWRGRTLPNNRGFRVRKKWHAIPIATAFEQAVVYDILYGSQDEFKYSSYGNLNKLYSDILKERKTPKDTGYKDRVNTICDKTLRKIKTLKYANYLEQCKIILSEIDKSKHFRGITLYKFETASSLYRITSQVNSFLEATTETERESVIWDSYFLNDVHFTSMYNTFRLIDDYEKMSHCVETFNLLLGEFILTTILVLDDLVERGCFGGGDDWYSFFLEVINKKAEKLLYNSDEIVFIIEPEHKRNSQVLFETILSIPVLMHYIDDDSDNDE